MFYTGILTTFTLTALVSITAHTHRNRADENIWWDATVASAATPYAVPACNVPQQAIAGRPIRID